MDRGDRAIRLAICTDTFTPQVNGVARTLDRLTDAVRARGGEVRVWTPRDPGASPRPDVSPLPSTSFWAYPELRLTLARWEPVARDILDWQPTVVHAATPFGAGLAGRHVALSRGIPLVTSYHTNFSAYARFYRLGWLASPGWRFLRWFHNSGRRTYAPSGATAGELRARGFRRVKVWSRGVDTTRFAPSYRSDELRAQLGALDGRILVGYVGRMAREKGLETLLGAMHELDRELPGRFVFAFAGDGPYLATMRRASPASARFLGRLEGEALSRFHASLDLFTFPSTTDTFGNVLLEAMASGVPVLAAESGPSRDILADGRGVLYHPGSALNLARALHVATAQPARLGAMRTASLAYARRHGWARIFDDLMDDYRMVITEARTEVTLAGRRVVLAGI
ncbi:MAG TPA: glycosyltransferase family 1 protein [Gemmatimonadaceae bacterium]|nr:glycosyltransferase family 1 protein [Gemmatimonadaceae bacterium]